MIAQTLSRPRVCSSLLHLLLLALLPSSAPAAAADETRRRAAVLPLWHDSGVDAPRAEVVRHQLTAAVKRAGHQAAPPAEVDRQLVAVDMTCTSAQCLGAAARVLDAELLVGGRLEAADGGGADQLSLSVWLFDAARQTTMATTRDQCAACDREQLGRWAGEVATRLLEDARSAARGARITVRSVPPGAAIRLDGDAIGVTNMSFGVSSGRHTVALQLAGHRSSVSEVFAPPGEAVAVDVTLEPEPQVTKSGDQGAPLLSLRTWKWVGVGAAAAGLAAGVPLLILDGQQTCTRDAAGAQCPEVLDTSAVGIGLTCAGAAASIAAAVLFYLDAQSVPRRVAVLPAGPRRSAGASAAFAF